MKPQPHQRISITTRIEADERRRRTLIVGADAALAAVEKGYFKETGVVVDHVPLLTKRPTRAAEILPYADLRGPSHSVNGP